MSLTRLFQFKLVNLFHLFFKIYIFPEQFKTQRHDKAFNLESVLSACFGYVGFMGESMRIMMLRLNISFCLMTDKNRL